MNQAANCLGQWDRATAYGQKCVTYALATEDVRLRVVGWWRSAATQIYSGRPREGMDLLKNALSLTALPFDAAMVKAMQGIAEMKLGDVQSAVRDLSEAVQWFEQSHIHFTRAFWGVRLAEAHVAAGNEAAARTVAEDIRATSRQLGYAFMEGIAERVLGEVLSGEDPVAAAAHLQSSEEILGRIGARNELARTLTARGSLLQAAGDRGGARVLFERALAMFEELGTVDEPARVRAALAGLD
ncbi:MAG: hypothetical protein HY216_08320 [Candidatus Rokubacteria bacterium]|nr:hypothetical protein [Candidatus Rokubacteria bacterium]